MLMTLWFSFILLIFLMFSQNLTVLNFDKNIKFTIDDFLTQLAIFSISRLPMTALIFSVKQLTQVNTRIFQVLNLSTAKPLGLIFYSFAHLRSVSTSNQTLFDNQIRTLKSFMSWNGFPLKIRNFFIHKLKNKVTSNINSSEQNTDSDSPKIYFRIPYLGKQGEILVSNVIRKIRRSLKIHIKPIVIYQTKKTSFFCPKKDKIPELCKTNVVFKCPETRLTQHATNYNNSSAISQHLLDCPDQ